MKTAANLQGCLAATASGDFPTRAADLLTAMGYHSTRTLPGQSGDAADFLAQFPAANPDTQSERAFREHATSARLLFQLTDAEIAAATATQGTLFDADAFAESNARSFLFVAVELDREQYARGRYAAFTREINKRLSQPAVVLFKTTSNLLTLAFVHRRENRRDPNRDVLGSVSLIREINPDDPHRAHLDVLQDLALDERLAWMQTHGKPANFDGLLAAWLDALDTEALNRRFYRELAAWFGRAVEEAAFPTDEAVTLPPEEHLIRLITRLLFVWFMKEKGLVAGDLFVEARVNDLLNDYDREGGDAYYRAVLQNLFFATLNTEMAQRRFSRKTHADHRNFSLYRYREAMRDPDALRALFDQTPFINGGLFDCLDSFAGARADGVRIDCFSDVHFGKLSLPNRLFFDDGGLIPLLNRYKFTVEENTPVEQEVALDPELLGKVFENLLAAYTPETRETARKQTGSYYTPRQVVDYMVEEALVASLAQTCQPTVGGREFWQARLRYLLDYADAFNDAHELFDADETAGLVRAIAGLKVLDPAVGSGAFPMGVLHKLTLALRRLDPDNNRWEALQKELARDKADAAFETTDQDERNAELLDISETFERYRDSDFGRKLYLMQNSIFGVDVQPVACQIAKLRFFISLAIEQEADLQAENFGIKPLPNLETRFIAADTLLHLKTAGQLDLFRQQIESLKTRLAENRERHFHATTRRQKLACKDADRTLRQELAQVLHAAGLPKDDAGKIAQWDPYDQNARADWFDADYMFGNRAGFDVVIGNPPYVQLQKNSGELGRRYESTGYETFARTGDLYQLFYEKGCQLLKPRHGLLAYITSNSWLKAEYGKGTRRYFAKRHTPLHLLEMGKDIFENTIVDTNVLLLREGSGDSASPAIAAVDMDQLAVKDFPPDAGLWGQTRPDGEKPWSILSATEQRIMDKMQATGTPLKDWGLSINRGITTGCNDAFIIDDATRRALVAEDAKYAEIIEPMLRGRDIQRYQAQWAGLWLLNIPWHFPLHFDSSIQGSSNQAENLFEEQYPAIYQYLLSHKRALSSRNKSETGIRYEWYALQRWGANYYEDFAKEKLIWMDLTDRGRFAYDAGGMFCVNTAFVMSGHSIKFLCAILNANLMTYFMKRTALNSGMGVTRWIRTTVETIPIPKLPAAEQRPFIRLVDDILAAKAADPSADTSAPEAEIDRLVYGLYGLDDEEMATVEGAR